MAMTAESGARLISRIRIDPAVQVPTQHTTQQRTSADPQLEGSANREGRHSSKHSAATGLSGQSVGPKWHYPATPRLVRAPRRPARSLWKKAKACGGLDGGFGRWRHRVPSQLSRLPSEQENNSDLHQRMNTPRRFRACHSRVIGACGHSQAIVGLALVFVRREDATTGLFRRTVQQNHYESLVARQEPKNTHTPTSHPIPRARAKTADTQLHTRATHARTDARNQTHTRTRTYTHTRAHSHAHTHTHTHTQARKHTHVSTQAHTHARTRIFTRTRDTHGTCRPGRARTRTPRASHNR